MDAGGTLRSTTRKNLSPRYRVVLHALIVRPYGSWCSVANKMNWYATPKWVVLLVATIRLSDSICNAVRITVMVVIAFVIVIVFAAAAIIIITRRLYCVEWTQYSIHPKQSRNRCFPEPTRVVDANGISIASAVFAGLTRWHTDWQTDTQRYSVGNNRRSARWRSQILLLSTATASIYWSSRFDRSNQLQQSAAIFSCKTRRVAVYVETH